MSPSQGEKEPSTEARKSLLKVFLSKLRKRRMLETLAAFIGGGCLLIEDEKTIFLKTVIPSRKMTRKYLGGKRHETK
jgi:hypothetical protein